MAAGNKDVAQFTMGLQLMHRKGNSHSGSVTMPSEHWLSINCAIWSFGIESCSFLGIFVVEGIAECIY